MTKKSQYKVAYFLRRTKAAFESAVSFIILPVYLGTLFTKNSLVRSCQSLAKIIQWGREVERCVSEEYC